MLTQSGHKQVLQRHGQWGFHLCKPERVESILDGGIQPPEQSGFAPRNSGQWLARPGHIYLYTMQALQECLRQGRRLPRTDLTHCLLDLTALDPTLINADEDAFWADGTLMGTYKTLDARAYGLPSPAHTVKSKWLLSEENEQRPYDSYGQWAHENRVGSVEATSLEAIFTTSAIAYGGTAPCSSTMDTLQVKEFLAELSRLD